MKIVFVANGITEDIGQPGLSGSDSRFIEIGKRWQRKGIDIHVITSRAGVDLCNKLGLKATFHVTDMGQGPIYWSYVRRAMASVSKGNMKDAVICSTTPLICDVLPAMRLKKSLGGRWAATVHWIEDPPWKRGLHFGPDWFDAGLNNLNEALSFPMIKRFADVVLAVSSNTAELVKNAGFKKERIRIVENGIDHQSIRKLNSKPKLYDGCYMKRLHPGKGVYDAIRIWERVCREVENAKLVLAGSSTERVISHVKEMIRQKGLEKNIEYLGVLYDLDKKFGVLKQSRILIHPSYAENWGIIIGESMACGTPVLFYDLPVLRDIWKRGSIGIRTGDVDDFARTVINLLRDKETLAELSKEATDYARQFDWDVVAEKEMKILENP